jgi:hypothetical protein
LLATQVCSDALLQHLTLMAHEDLPEAAEYNVGPLKLLYDEGDLPSLESVADASFPHVPPGGRSPRMS